MLETRVSVRQADSNRQEPFDSRRLATVLQFQGLTWCRVAMLQAILAWQFTYSSSTDKLWGRPRIAHCTHAV